MAKSSIRRFAIDRKNAPALSREAIRAEANIGLQLECLMGAWASLAKDSRNKNDWNNFAKYVLNEIQDIDKIFKEVKNE
jgi:hypothetical protein|tara:strand:+ start:44 stop:280 length:237 start_codon:yes stop_codon:yes gene_type:complete